MTTREVLNEEIIKKDLEVEKRNPTTRIQSSEINYAGFTQDPKREVINHLDFKMQEQQQSKKETPIEFIIERFVYFLLCRG